MAKRVILAVAGAGKTYRICHEMQPEQKNLIVAFTHANIKNIQNELLKEHGKIPDATRIMTFDAFVYHMIIRPYEKTIYNFFGQNYKFEKTSTTSRVTTIVINKLFPKNLMKLKCEFMLM